MGKPRVTIVVPGRGAVEAESADGAFQLLPALTAPEAPRFDGHFVAEALRREADVRVLTKCGRTFYFDVPVTAVDRARAEAPLTCTKCQP